MTTDMTRPLALVTGASSGIGFQLAKQFADNGFDLIIAAEDAELTTATADLQAAGGCAERRNRRPAARSRPTPTSVRS